MALSEELRSVIGEAIDAGKVVTQEELLQRFPKTVTVMQDGSIYLNPWVTAEVDSTSPTEVTHVKIVVLQQQGYFVIVPAAPGEKGAVPFERGDSRRTGTIDARVALLAFNIAVSEKRKLNLPVVSDLIRTGGGEQKVLAIRVKRPKSRKSIVRPRKKAPAASAPEQAAGEAK